MVVDHKTGERVYSCLKADLLDGAWDSRRLNINILADAYYASATPVREALLRLVGEGLLDMPDTGGFAIPRMNPAQIADDYGLSLALAQLVVKHLPTHPGVRGVTIGPSPLAHPIDAVLTSLAAASGNSALERSVASLNDRLHRIRRLEERRLNGLTSEIANIIETIEQYNLKRLRQMLVSYHRRRQRCLTRILGIVA